MFWHPGTLTLSTHIATVGVKGFNNSDIFSLNRHWKTARTRPNAVVRPTTEKKTRCNSTVYVIKIVCLIGTGAGPRLSAEQQCCTYGDLALLEQTVVDQFCHISVSPINDNASSTLSATQSTTMFFKSFENSSCGSVTIKSELQEPSGTSYPDARLQEMDTMEPQHEFWNWETSFETPPCDDSSSSFNSQSEAERSNSHVIQELDISPRRLSICPSHNPVAIQPSTFTPYFQTILTPSELPTTVSCLLTPPDSLQNSPTGDEPTTAIPDLVGCSSPSSPDEVFSPLEKNGLLVLTPVTQRPRRTHPGCTTIRYNRKNNPELDRRRVHFCDFPG